MKLPWVSRAEFDRVMHELVEERLLRTNADRAVDRLEERYDALLTKYHQLKLQGFTVQPEPRQPAPQPETPQSRIARVIDAIPASRDPRNRVLMWAKVAEDRAAGVPDEEIVMRIQRGTRPAEELE